MSGTLSNVLAATGVMLMILSMAYVHIDQVGTAGIMAVIGAVLVAISFAD